MLSQSFVFAISALLYGVTAQDCSGGPPKGTTVTICCPGGGPKLLTKSLAEQCGNNPEANGANAPGGLGKHLSCDAVQCMLKRSNILTAENKINKSAIKTHLENTYWSNAEWRPIIDKIIQVCDSGANMDATDACEPRRYSNCIKKTAFLNCPSSIAVNTPECSRLRNYMQNCQMRH